MNALSLCSGAGGLELGLRLAMPDLRVVAYCERDAFAASVLLARMEDESLEPAPIWCGDLREFNGRAFAGRVDIVSAGFPCQPFSSAGKQQGLADERWIWPDIARIIADCGASLVLIENVPGLALHGLRAVLESLAGLGFDAEWDLFSAAQVGAPHRRERLFLLAWRVSDAIGHVLRLEPERGASAERQADPWDAEPGDVGEDVADYHRSGLRAISGEATRGSDVDDSHQGVGDTASGRHDSRVRETSSKSRREARKPNCLLGDSRSTARRREPEPSPGLEARRSEMVWPPGPDCPPDRWPEDVPQPAVRRGANGLAYRVDRLRAAGNGVVPLVAGYAFRTLAARAGLMEADVTEATA